MTTKEAQSLKVGDRVVIFAGTSDACEGIVTLIGWDAFDVQWDDEEMGIIAFDDAQDVMRVGC